jgi:hypothetical protein
MDAFDALLFVLAIVILIAVDVGVAIWRRTRR